MTEAVQLLAEKRGRLGTGAARSLRREGNVPAIIYGAGKEPMNITVKEKEITRLYRKKQFISTVIDLDISGTHYSVLPKSVELHPIKEIVTHMDFVFLEKEWQKMEVPLVFEGKEKSLGVKRGGFFNIIKRTILLLCPVNQIPRNITIDVNNLSIGQSIKASELTLPEGCSLINKKDFIIASITGRGGKSADTITDATTPAAAPEITTAKAKPADKAK